jgi:hypothetical protein
MTWILHTEGAGKEGADVTEDAPPSRHSSSIITRCSFRNNNSSTEHNEGRGFESCT